MKEIPMISLYVLENNLVLVNPFHPNTEFILNLKYVKSSREKYV